jgi:hypothetical protein
VDSLRIRWIGRGGRQRIPRWRKRRSKAVDTSPRIIASRHLRALSLPKQDFQVEWDRLGDSELSSRGRDHELETRGVHPSSHHQ